MDAAIEERSNLFGCMGSANGKPRGELVDALQNHQKCRTWSLFCGFIGLFCGFRGLFCGFRGLFCGFRGLFCGFRGYFCGFRGLFCGFIGSFSRFLGLFCGFRGLSGICLGLVCRYNRVFLGFWVMSTPNCAVKWWTPFRSTIGADDRALLWISRALLRIHRALLRICTTFLLLKHTERAREKALFSKQNPRYGCFGGSFAEL